jgi:hypothetical protein
LPPRRFIGVLPPDRILAFGFAPYAEAPEEFVLPPAVIFFFLIAVLPPLFIVEGVRFVIIRDFPPARFAMIDRLWAAVYNVLARLTIALPHLRVDFIQM